MVLCVNGSSETLRDPCSLEQYLHQRGIDARAVVTEHNCAIVQVDQRAQVMLADGDTIEILRFVGGGA